MNFSEKTQDLGNKLAGLSSKEGIELAAYLQEVHGISNGIIHISYLPMPGEGDVTPVPKPVSIILTEVIEPIKRIMLMKEIRRLMRVDLQMAAAIVKGPLPKLLKTDVPFEDALAIKSQLEVAGAGISFQESVAKERRDPIM